jgi:hypothetical protein
LAGGGEDLRGEKPKRAKGCLFGMNNPGKGIRLQAGRKSLERRVDWETGSQEAQERRDSGKPGFDRFEEQSSEGRSPRALKVERHLQG